LDGWFLFMILNEFVLVPNSSFRVKLGISTETGEEIKLVLRQGKKSISTERGEEVKFLNSAVK